MAERCHHGESNCIECAIERGEITECGAPFRPVATGPTLYCTRLPHPAGEQHEALGSDPLPDGSERNLRAQQSPEQSPATGSHPSTGSNEQPLVTEQPATAEQPVVTGQAVAGEQPVVARPEAVSEQPLVTRPAVVSVDAQLSDLIWNGPPDHPGRGNLPLWAGSEPQEPDDDDAPRPVSAPPLNDPPHIHRAVLLRALESLGITDTGYVARVVVTPEDVTVTRYIRAPSGKGIVLDMLRDQAATTTTRIEIR